MNKVRLKALLKARGLDVSDEELEALAAESEDAEAPAEEVLEDEELADEGLEDEPAEEEELEEEEVLEDEELAEEELEEEPAEEEELEEEEVLEDEELEEEEVLEDEELADEDLEEEPAEEELAEPDELALALERIATLEAELADYRMRDARQGAERVLVEAHIKPKFYDIVITQLAGVDLSTDEGRAALDALTAEFPEFLLEQETYPEIPPPAPAGQIPRGRNRSMLTT